MFKKVNLFLALVMFLSVLHLVLLCNTYGTTATAPSGDQPIKIGLTMKFDDLWLTTLRDAMTAYAQSQPGVELIVVDSKGRCGDSVGSGRKLRGAGGRAIIIIPANTDAADPMTKAAQDAGIPLVYVNRIPSNLPEGVAYVGSDSIQLELCRRNGLPKN